MRWRPLDHGGDRTCRQVFLLHFFGKTHLLFPSSCFVGGLSRKKTRPKKWAIISCDGRGSRFAPRPLCQRHRSRFPVFRFTGKRQLDTLQLEAIYEQWEPWLRKIRLEVATLRRHGNFGQRVGVLFHVCKASSMFFAS